MPEIARALLFVVALAGGMAVVGLGRSARSAEADSAEVESVRAIEAWLADLDSDQFVVRERAMRRLVEAAPASIDPLARAADGDVLEVATRAVRILFELSDSEDPTLAREALDRLAGLENRPTEQRGAQAILDQRLEEEAVAEVKKRGGRVTIRLDGEGQAVIQQLLIGRAWTGADDGFMYVARLRSLRQLAIVDIGITDRGIAHLRDLPALSDARLFGTGVTAEGLEMLRKAAPLAKIDHRGGALLGVGGLPDSVRAEVVRVVPGSAAAAAGLVPRDVITKVNGKPVGNFEQLTREIGRFHGGEKAVLEIERSGRTLEIDVTFGKWTKWSE